MWERNVAGGRVRRTRALSIAVVAVAIGGYTGCLGDLPKLSKPSADAGIESGFAGTPDNLGGTGSGGTPSTGGLGTGGVSSTNPGGSTSSGGVASGGSNGARPDAGADSGTPVCGNHVVEGGETCDGNCPVSCDDGEPCTRDDTTGAAATCTLSCTHVLVPASQTADGCCPTGATPSTDADCSANCGNGVIETGETCDKNCPASCDDGDPCTADNQTGSASTCNISCAHTKKAAATATMDGCCPAGADSKTDSDCAPKCGNGVVETGETCDGNCPTSCDDGEPCTTDQVTGSAATCNVGCKHTAKVPSGGVSDGCCAAGANASTDVDCSASCGNGIVEPGETCDKNCPASCDDGNACTTDSQVGSASTCNIACSHTNKGVSGATSDGCCPSGASNATDTDCAAVCGNGLIETGETCDGNCPTSCDDGVACTNDVVTGTAQKCNVVCTHSGKGPSGATVDGCCPPGANNNTDKDCKAICGNGIVESGEQCDGPDTWHCSPVCQSRQIYTVCQPGDTNPCGTSNPGPVQCDQFICAPVSPNYQLNGCPQLAGNYTQGIYFAQFCAISCNTVADCPPQFSKCFQNPFRSADAREVLNYCTN